MSSLAIDEKLFKKIATIILISILVLLTFLIMEPILISTIFGLILAFVFYPVYKILDKRIKIPNISALLITLGLVVIILIPVFLLIPVVVEQTFGIYTDLQKVDLLTPLQNFLPGFLSTQELSKDVVVAINSFTSNIASSFLNSFIDILLNSPVIMLHLVLILFVFFFGLRDGHKLVAYLQDVSPLSKESEHRVFTQFKDITYSVIFGQIIVGIVQGIVTGIGLLIFGVPNALILALVATFVGILPIIGPWLVWIPANIYLFLAGRTGAAIGLLIYGLVVITWVDTLIRPYIVSRRTKINAGVILVSMLGGLFMFGVLGLILGPLIISYLLLLLDFYRSKKTPGLIEIIKKAE